MKYLFVFIISITTLCGCVSKTAKATIDTYNQIFERVLELERVVATADFSVFTGDEICQMYAIGTELYYDYNPMDLKPEQVVVCEALKGRVDTFIRTHEGLDAFIDSL